MRRQKHKKDEKRGEKIDGTNKLEIIRISVDILMMAMYSNFEIQQVAVDFVVNIGVVLLLAQIQTWDVHGSLETQEDRQIFDLIHVSAASTCHALEPRQQLHSRLGRWMTRCQL